MIRNFATTIIATTLLFATLLPTTSHSNEEDFLEITHSNRTISSAIAYNILRPLITNRIDFHLKNSGVISKLQEREFDNKSIEIINTINGEGKTKCGEKVTINIRAVSNGINIYEKNNYTQRIGHFEIQALNIGLIGMGKGGKRIIVLPAKIAPKLDKKHNLNKVITYEVELQKIHKPLNKNLDNMLIFNSSIGSGKAAMCGETITLEYKLRDARGKPLEKKITEFKIGSNAMPIALELGAIEMQKDMRRTIIAPPELFETSNGNHRKFQKASKNEISIIDLELKSIQN